VRDGGGDKTVGAFQTMQIHCHTGNPKLMRARNAQVKGSDFCVGRKNCSLKRGSQSLSAIGLVEISEELCRNNRRRLLKAGACRTHSM